MFEAISDFLYRLAVSPLWPVYEFLHDGTSRYFWLYCITGFVIAALVHQSYASERTFGDTMFNRDTWASRSALNDYYIVVIGAALRLTILSWVLIKWKPIAAFVVSVLTWLGVTGTVNDSYAFVIGAALTVSLFVVDDFLKFVVHYYAHKVPELWEFHKIHHSAEHLNFATAERIHPAEIVLTTFAVAIGIGVVNGLFIAFFGDKITPFTVFGANVLLVLVNIFGGVLRHSPMWISFGPKVEKWIISPAMHQIHHSDDPRHYDSNMGVSLAIWDRMFGTHYFASDRTEITGFGIGEETRDFRSLKVIYFRPFIRSFELVRDRVRQLLGSPSPTPSA